MRISNAIYAFHFLATIAAKMSYLLIKYLFVYFFTGKHTISRYRASIIGILKDFRVSSEVIACKCESVRQLFDIFF